MKYLFSILALLLIVGIGFGAQLDVDGSNYGASATTTYDWTLVKTANRTDLEFVPPPDPEAEAVVFTIDITRSAPYSQTQLIGHIDITNIGLTTATITSVKDSIVYQVGLPPGIFVYDTILFSDSHTLDAGATWTIPMVITFSSPYPLGPFSYHYNHVLVHTDDGGLFQYSDAFHTLPSVVNETLHVWDAITVPSSFGYNWDYNGPLSVHGDTTFFINLSLTNQSAPPGSYQVINIASGSNECGYWADTVVIQLHVTPCDSEWHGITFTHGYWKNHTCAFAGYLPITIAGTSVNTVRQATSILNNASARNAWNSFLCHFLTIVFNTRYNPSLLSAIYNNRSQTGEFMERQTVSYIISVANGYRSNTQRATLLTMKDVFDAINNNATTHVLWLGNGGGSGSNTPLSPSDFISLYPNPFNEKSEIRFLTEVKEPAELKIYDLSGAKVRDLVKATNSSLYWDGTDNDGKKLRRGVYIIRLENSNLPATVKAVIHR